MKPGDQVTMNDNYHVSDANKGKVWTVKSEPWNCCGTMVVKLDGKSGGYRQPGLDQLRGRRRNNDQQLRRRQH